MNRKRARWLDPLNPGNLVLSGELRVTKTIKIVDEPERAADRVNDIILSYAGFLRRASHRSSK